MNLRLRRWMVTVPGLFLGIVVMSAQSCESAKDTAKETGREAVTATSKVLTETARSGWREPVADAVVGPWEPGDGDHVGRDLEAVDYLAPAGTAVYAIGDGRVAWAGFNCQTRGEYCYGNTVVVDHGDGLYSLYTHLGEKPDFKPGTRVTGDTQMGIVGTSGCVECAPHVHFVMRRGEEGLRDMSVLFERANEPVKARETLRPR